MTAVTLITLVNVIIVCHGNTQCHIHLLGSCHHRHQHRHSRPRPCPHRHPRPHRHRPRPHPRPRPHLLSLIPSPLMTAPPAAHNCSQFPPATTLFRNLICNSILKQFKQTNKQRHKQIN